MNKEFAQLSKKDDVELCALVVRLSSQLLESRFKLATGEIEKTHLLQSIRRNLARCLFILKTRGYKTSIGSHGIYLLEEKTNKIHDFTKKVNDFVSSQEKEQTKAKKSTNNKPVENVEPKAEKPTTKVESKPDNKSKVESTKKEQSQPTTKEDK